MKKFIVVLTALVLVLVVVMSASDARADYVLNGGFESPTLDDGTETTDEPDDWNWIVADSTHLNPAAGGPHPAAYEGENMIMTQGSLRAVGQNIQIPGGMLADTVYTLTTYVNGSGAFNVDWGNVDLDQDFFVDTGGLWEAAITSLDTAVNPEYVGETVVELELVHLPAAHGGSDTEPMYHDGVSLVGTPIPEPSTLVLLAVGMAAMLLWRRR